MIIYIGSRKIVWRPKKSSIPVILLISEEGDADCLDSDRVGNRMSLYDKIRSPEEIDDYMEKYYAEALPWLKEK